MTYIVILQIVTLPVLVIGLFAISLQALRQHAQARVRAFELRVLQEVSRGQISHDAAGELLATMDEFRTVQSRMTVPRGAVAAWMLRNVDNGDLNHLERARMHARDADELVVIDGLQHELNQAIVVAMFFSSVPSVFAVYPLALFVLIRRLRLRTPIGRPMRDVLVREVRAAEKVQRRRDHVAMAS